MARLGAFDTIVPGRRRPGNPRESLPPRFRAPTLSRVTPPSRRRDLVVGACVLLVTVAVVRLGVDREMMVHVHSLRGSQPLTDAEVPLIEHLRQDTHWALWVARLLLGVAVVAWMAVARRIVQTYDCDLYRSDPDFAVTGWILPPINLAAPYLLMADVWTASHPTRRPEAVVSRLKVPRRILIWWGLFLLSTVIGVMGVLDGVHGGSPWAPFDVHLDYAVLTCQIVSAVMLAWTVVPVTGFIEERTRTATL